MRAAVKKMLSAITIMLAMFASEPSVPAVWMPQVGLTPTGAEAESAETPWRRLLSARWTWGKSNRQQTNEHERIACAHLAVEEVAPGARGDVLAEQVEVAEAGHVHSKAEVSSRVRGKEKRGDKHDDARADGGVGMMPSNRKERGGYSVRLQQGTQGGSEEEGERSKSSSPAQ